MRYFTDSPFERMMMQIPRSRSAYEQPEPDCSGCSLTPLSCGKDCGQHNQHAKKEKIEDETCLCVALHKLIYGEQIKM